MAVLNHCPVRHWMLQGGGAIEKLLLASHTGPAAQMRPTKRITADGQLELWSNFCTILGTQLHEGTADEKAQAQVLVPVARFPLTCWLICAERMELEQMSHVMGTPRMRVQPMHRSRRRHLALGTPSRKCLTCLACLQSQTSVPR